MKKIVFSCIILICGLTAFSQNAENYNWKSVTINGGGYVPGFVFSKAEKDLLYARTDIGGAYRWDEPNKKWIPLTDFVTSGNQLGVISMAADPKDASRVYMVTGLYSNSWDPYGKFYSSTDKGDSWKEIIAPFKVGGNEGGRGSGERLMVDPNLTSRLFFGSQKQGMFLSENYGDTWTQISSFTKSRVNCIEIDPTSGTANNPSQDIYASTVDNLIAKDTTIGGLYKSADGGLTWQYLVGQPIKIEPKDYDNPKVSTPAVAHNIAFAGDFIYFTYGNDLAPGTSNGFVMKYNKITKVWTKIHPFSKNTQGGYNSLSVHPTNPDIVVVGTLGHWWPTSDRIYLTKDGGTTWVDIRTKMKTNNKNTPHGGGMGWNSGFKIDPFNPDHALFGSGNGLWMTYDLTKALSNDTTSWVYENDNFEETAVLSLVSPSSGAQVISGLGDIKGFVHTDLTKSPANTFHHHGNTYVVDFAENVPSTIVRTHDGGVRASISKDNGVTWSDFATQAQGGDARTNSISISPDGNTIVWSPNDTLPSYSINGGASWTVCQGLANAISPKSDRVNSSIFYAYNSANGEFLKSTDKAKTFVKTSTLPFTGSASITPVFGKEGHVWVAASGNGLYYTTNGGSTFTKVSNLAAAYKVSLGKAAPGGNYPCVFIQGKINERTGFFKSKDMGQNWIKINNQEQEYGRSFPSMCADPKVYGRLYIGTHGRGILYGDISGNDCQAPLLPQSLTLCESSFTTLRPDNAISISDYTFTWRRDGLELESTLDSIVIYKGGEYQLSISKTGCPDASDKITVISQFVDINNVSICKGETASLQANYTSSFLWTNENEEEMGTTQSISVTPISTSHYYVRDTKTTPYAIGLPTFASGGWGLGSQFDNNQNKVKLTVTQSLRLKGISLHVNGAGTNGVVRLIDKNGEIYAISSKSGLATGTQEIPFDVILKPGEYIVDAVGTTGSIQFQSERTGVNWSVPNYVKLESVPGWAYGIFFNLKFEVGNTCAATPVEVKVNTPEAITFNYQIDGGTWAKGTTATLCNGSDIQFAAWPVNGSTWSWTGPNSFTSNVRNPFLSNITSDKIGTYSTTHTDANGCSANASFDLEACVVTSTINEDITFIEVYPNPSTGSFRVKFKDETPHQVTLVDLVGKEVFNATVSNREVLETNLPGGVYLLKMAANSSQQFKVVIE